MYVKKDKTTSCEYLLNRAHIDNIVDKIRHMSRAQATWSDDILDRLQAGDYTIGLPLPVITEYEDNSVANTVQLLRQHGLTNVHIDESESITVNTTGSMLLLIRHPGQPPSSLGLPTLPPYDVAWLVNSGTDSSTVTPMTDDGAYYFEEMIRDRDGWPVSGDSRATVMMRTPSSDKFNYSAIVRDTNRVAFRCTMLDALRTMVQSYMQTLEGEDASILQLLLDEPESEVLLAAMPEHLAIEYDTLQRQLEELTYSYGWLSVDVCNRLLGKRNAVWLMR
jgi:hypothetical protein